MREAIIIFTRVPIPGRTKTRLQGFLTKDQCAQIHKNFLKDIKKTCEKLNKDIFVFYTPEDKDNILKDILGEKCNYKIQQGNDLGEKIPYLKKEDLSKAFKILRKKDVVLGPTEDKGYYLVGMKKSNKAVFENIEYGHGNVLDNTISSIKNANLTCYLTNKNVDIDDKDDLLYFYNEITKGRISENTNTSKFIVNVIEEYKKECLRLTV